MRKTLLSRIFFFGIFILPFIYWSHAVIPFEIPKVWAYQRWIELLILFFLFGLPKTLTTRNINTRLLYIVLGFFITSVLVSLLGSDMGKSIAGNYWRGDGLVTLLHHVLFSVFLMLWWEKSYWTRFVQVMCVSSVLLSLYSVFHVSSFTPPFGNSVFLAGYLTVTLPIWLGIKNSPMRWTGLIVQILAIVSTKAWGGILGILLFSLLYIRFFVQQKIRNALFFIACLGIFSVMGVWFVHWYQVRLPYQIMAEGRTRIFTKGALAFAQRPILGWGWANFDHAFDSVDWPYHFEIDAYVDKAHSELLEILVTTGLVGIVFYILLIWRVGGNLWKNKTISGKILFSMFLLYLFHSQTNVISVSEMVIFWFIVGTANVRV